MTFRYKHYFFLLFLVLLCACGPGNALHLRSPKLPSVSVLPAPNAASIAVVLFKDQREDFSDLGTRRDGSAFISDDNVAQWLSHALADELRQQALQVSFALNSEQAYRGNPDYVVSGEILKISLKESSVTGMNTSLQVKYTLYNKQKKNLLEESVNSVQSRTGFPSKSAAEEILLATMLDVVKPIAQKIGQHIGTLP